MVDTPTKKPEPIAVLVHEEPCGRIGLKIPGFGVEMYGEDLVELVELAEEDLWWRIESGEGPVPEEATLVIRRVTKEEFGPRYFETRDESEGGED